MGTNEQEEKLNTLLKCCFVVAANEAQGKEVIFASSIQSQLLEKRKHQR
jgi:hypothetical protein